MSKSQQEKREKQCRVIWNDILRAREAENEELQEKLLTKCMAICRHFEESNTLRITTEISLASLFSQQGRGEEALPFLNQAIAHLKKSHDAGQDFKADTYLHASNSYRNMNRFRDAERMANAALKIAIQHKLKHYISESNEALYLCRYTQACELMGERKYERAEEVFLQGVENIRPAEFNRRWREGMTRCCIAVCAGKQNKNGFALEQFEKSLILLSRESNFTVQDLHFLFFSIDEFLGKANLKSAGSKRVADASARFCLKLRKKAKIVPADRAAASFKLHGKTIEDPYQWLEDVDAPAVMEWSRRENDYAELFLCALGNKAKVQAAIESSVIRHKPSVPVSIKKNYYFVAELQDSSEKALWTCTPSGKKKKILIHPLQLLKQNEGGITNFVMSSNGRHVAYGITQGGSEWQTWRIFDLKTKKPLRDVLTGLIHEYVLWLPGGKSFLYIKHKQPKQKSKRGELLRFPSIYMHRVGTLQSSDKLIYRRLDKPDWYIGPSIAMGGKITVLTNWTEEADKCIVLAKKEKSKRLLSIFPKADAAYRYFTSRKGHLYFITDKDADRGRVISVAADAARGTFSKAKEVIAEKKFLLDSAYEGTDHLLLHYLENGFSRIRKYDWNTMEADGELKLPFAGTVSDLRWVDDGNTYLIAATSYLHPETVFKFSPKKRKPTVFFQSEKPGIGKGFTTTLVKYKSKDGTEIPMHIVHKKGLKLDGNQPLLLYVYGGFGRSLTPEYTYDVMAWLKLGGVYAAPLLRGGGELGTKWHTDAILEGKEKTIEDIAAAANWLKKNGWTNSKRMAVYGGSNGGLMAATTLVRHPKLFAAGVIVNGLYDMLRYHRSTLAWTWLPEYGCADNKDQFQYLLKYSPLHNLKEGTKYPAVFISAARGDDRVMPWHSFKLAAALRHAQNNKGQILLRVEEEAGHAWSRPSDRVKDQLLFLMHALKM